MGPAFALVFVAVLGLVVFALAFGVACIFYTRFVALIASAAFVVGAVAGGLAFLVATWLVVGSTTFTHRWQVATFLACWVFSAILVGGLLAFVFVRALRRSNISSKRTRVPRAA